MSTIMRFSARSFSDSRRPAAWASSSSTVSPRGAVPFIGRVVIRPPSRRKNSSGEAHTTAKRPRSTSAAWRGRCVASSRAKSASGSSASGARSGNVKLTW